MDWRWLYYWLIDHEPIFCAFCGRLMFRKDAYPTQTLYGQMVDLCETCRRKWFHPEEP